MFIFGSGVAIVTPQGVTHPTPLNIGLLQEISLDIAQTLKPLYGQYRDPVAVGAGTRKWTGKAKVARMGAGILNNLIAGGTVQTGQVATAIGEAGQVPASSTYTITVTNSGTWTADQGVIYAATGLPLVNVASLTGAGQYTYSAGVYTFNSADASANVLISYNYTISATGEKILIPPALIGAPINWSLNASLIDPTTGKFMNVQVYNCVASKFNWGTKLEDWAMPEIDFECYANAAGNVLQYNYADGF